MTKPISDSRLEACIADIEKQLAKALKRLGKVRLPKKGESLYRAITVTSPADASIRVVVRYEHGGGFHNKPTGLYGVLVQEARGPDSRVKHRARDFTGLPTNLTNTQVDSVVACVAKHLAVMDQARLALNTREVERKRAEQKVAEQHARLHAIGKAHGIRSSDHGMMLDGGLTVRCQGADFQVAIDRVTEQELGQLLSFWKIVRPRA